MDQSVGESQNFHLRLSEDSNVFDSQSTSANNEKDVIVISDSSPTHSSHNYSSFKSKSLIQKHYTKSNEVYIVDSSDSDSSDEEVKLQTWKANKMNNFVNHDAKSKNIAIKNKIQYTSDETSSISSKQSEGCISNTNKTTSSYINTTPESKTQNMCKTSIQIYKKAMERNVLSSCATSSSSTSKSSNQASMVPMSNNKNNSEIKKKLTRRDAANIIKNIKSTRLVYESPRQQKENNVSNNESIHSIMHPAISPTDNLVANHKIIDETPVDSESDIVPDSQRNVTNFYKTHVSKFLDTPNMEKDVETSGPELSDRKKKQISQWLLTNSPDSKSDTSSSNVPATIGDDISSGNSSLERLEMVYETPNNRGKISHVVTTEKRVTIQDCDKTVHSTVSKQTTIHDFVQKSTKNGLELRTSKQSHTNNNILSTPTANVPQNVNITDCADILDKLYGKSWREKADKLLPTSEPRNQVISRKDRAIQTERRPKNKQKFYSTDSGDDNSNSSSNNLKLQNYQTKKNIQKNTKYRNSFINDETSSDSACETTYYTAVTNPRNSRNNVQSKPILPSTAQRALAICDTDSDEGNKSNDNEGHDTRRKKLSFSDDESDDKSEDSSTSEFDPGDAVPPKPTVKKNPTKPPRQTSKGNTRNESAFNKQRYEKHSSFLASLSESVPLSNAHPDAKKYRTDFKNNKENLCNHLYKLYNEKVFDKNLPEDMSIEWNVRMRGTAGYCYNKKSLKTLGGTVRSSRIVLATKVLDTPDRLRDTLIHEMCHAAAWLINDVSDGHGPFWTGWANKAMKVFPDLPPIRRCHDYKIKTKFTYKCVGCGYSIGRHSKSLDVERKRCGHCYGKFELLINKTTKSGTVQVQTPKREPSAFALFVKENYSIIKKQRNIKHADVMKVLGQQFSAIKIAKRQENCEDDVDTLG